MRTIFISGAWCREPMPAWPNICMAFKREFPSIRFMAIEQEYNLQPWQGKRMRAFRDRLVEKYDDGMKTLLVGHSIGGVVACEIARRFAHTPVRGVVTIFSPHTFLRGMFPRLLEAAGDVNAPIVSFEADADELVWWGTRHPRSIAHTRLWSNHKSDLVEHKELADQIAAITRQTLFVDKAEAPA